MKVSIKVPIASVLVASIKMENQYFYIREITALCRTAPQYATDGTNALIYLQIDKTVQGAGYGADINSQSAATDFQVIDNNKVETLMNFQRVSVATFRKGVSYLLPLTAYGSVPIIPNVIVTAVGGAGTGVAGVVPALNFRFDCPEDMDVLNGTAITGCITVEENGKVLQAYEEVKAVAKQQKAVAYAEAIGMAVTNPFKA